MRHTGLKPADDCFKILTGESRDQMKKLPPCGCGTPGPLSIPEMATYLEGLLRGKRPTIAVTVELPSLVDLSEFFHCTLGCLFQALALLARKGFRYQVHALDRPIRLRFPDGEARPPGRLYRQGQGTQGLPDGDLWATTPSPPSPLSRRNG